jgi:hypothetical protein
MDGNIFESLKVCTVEMCERIQGVCRYILVMVDSIINVILKINLSYETKVLLQHTGIFCSLIPSMLQKGS